VHLPAHLYGESLVSKRVMAAAWCLPAPGRSQPPTGALASVVYGNRLRPQHPNRSTIDCDSIALYKYTSSEGWSFRLDGYAGSSKHAPRYACRI